MFFFPSGSIRQKVLTWRTSSYDQRDEVVEHMLRALGLNELAWDASASTCSSEVQLALAILRDRASNSAGANVHLVRFDISSHV